VHGLFRGVGRDEQVAFDPIHRIAGNYESVAVAMHVETADDVAAAGSRSLILSSLDLNEVTAIDEAAQQIVQMIARFAFQPHLANELLEGCS
jgi:hypothetical protein